MAIILITFVTLANAQIPYWKEGISTNTTWIKVNLSAGINNFTITNISSTYQENGSNVFQFFDAFDTYNTSEWSTNSYLTASASNGWLKLTRGSTDNYGILVSSTSPFSGTGIIESKSYVATITSNTFFGMLGGYTNNLEYKIRSNYDFNSAKYTALSKDGGSYSYQSNYLTTIYVNDYYLLRGTVIDSTTVSGYANNLNKSVSYQHPNGTYTDTGQQIAFFLGWTGTSVAYLDYVYIRQYVSTEPTLTITNSTQETYKIYINSTTNLIDYQIAIPNISSTGNLNITITTLTNTTWNTQTTNNTIKSYENEINTTRTLEFFNDSTSGTGNIIIINNSLSNFSLNFFESGYKTGSTYTKFAQQEEIKDVEVDNTYCNTSSTIIQLDTVYVQTRPTINRLNLIESIDACFFAEKNSNGVDYNLSLRVNNNTIGIYNRTNYTLFGNEMQCQNFNPTILIDGINNITVQADVSTTQLDNFDIPICSRTDGGSNSITFTSTNQGGTWSNRTTEALPIFFNITRNITGTDIRYQFYDGEIGWVNVSGTYNGIQAANTTFNLTIDAIETHTFNITALDVMVINQSFATTIYETNFTTLTLTIEASTGVQAINGTLNWNNTTYNATPTIDGNNYTLTTTLQIPIQTINNTTVNFSWDYNITHNDSHITNKNNQNGSNQTILQAYIPQYILQSTTAEGQTFYTRINTTKIVDYANMTATVQFNNTNYTMTTETQNTTLQTLKQALASQSLNQTNQTFQLNYTLNITSAVGTRQETSSLNITIFQIGLTNCNVTTGNEVYTIYVRDEQDQNLLNSTIEVNAKLNTTNVEKNVTISFPQNNTHRICATPTTQVEYQLGMNIQYTANGYDTRNHQISTILNTNTSSTINLYTANLTDTDLWTIIVKDQGQLVESATVKVLRFFTTNNTNVLVATGTSNSQGRTQFNLYSTTVNYQFIVQQNNQTVLTTNTAPLTALSTEAKVIELEINTNTIAITQTYKSIQLSCTITTTNTTCTINDISGVMTQFNLQVNFINYQNGTTPICNLNAFTSTATLTCNNQTLFNGTGTFTYILTGTDSTNTILLQSGSITRKTNLFGQLGDLIAPFIILFLILIGLSTTKDSPIGILIGIILGISTIWVLNVTNSQNQGAMIILTLLILIKMKKGK